MNVKKTYTSKNSFIILKIIVQFSFLFSVILNNISQFM